MIEYQHLEDGYYWVYVLRCHDGSNYIGWTRQLRKRLIAQTAGRGARRVASSLPVCLSGAIQCVNADDAKSKMDELLPYSDSLSVHAGSAQGWYSGELLAPFLDGSQVGADTLTASNANSLSGEVILGICTGGLTESPNIGVPSTQGIPIQPDDTEFLPLLHQIAGEVLREREYIILSARYGLLGHKALTLEEIGQRHSLSRERIRQLLVRSLRKIKTFCNRQIRHRNYASSGARLGLFITNLINLGGPDVVDSAFRFSLEQLAHLNSRLAFQLVLHLSGLSRSVRDDYLKSLLLKDKAYRNSLKRKSKERTYRDKVPSLIEEHTYWFGPIRKEYPRTLGRARSVQLCRDNAGEFFSDKMQRTIQFESSLEMSFLLALERSSLVYSYQEQPFYISYDFRAATRRYFPDILVTLTDGRSLVVEIKPRWQMAFSVNRAKWTALKKLCVTHGLGLLVTDGTTSIKSMILMEVSAPFEQALLFALDKGNVSWEMLNGLRYQYSVSLNMVATVVLKNRLDWDYAIRRA